MNYYSYYQNGQQYYTYQPYPYYDTRSYPTNLYRQQPISGQATWTEGGTVTQCGIPWSHNEYMTAAVGTNTPYRCGQTLKIRNVSSANPKEILVEVVDRVPGFPPNRINLHRNAFRALGANPSLGVINIEIVPSPEVELEEWGKYLLAVTQAAYPGYNVTDYKFVGRSEVAPNQARQTYEFVISRDQHQMTVQGNVIYDINSNRVISFDIKEV
ncbi:DUF3889 domain-containing protein [Bacillus sp. PS06]|uniref:DUF3889 domain-containing protein n=1 Tax=Bacillus sp. PS06 TaxID=2764176 RepID=UPI00177B6A11|nr:DUF3889 domain-containing protein [Bacillus sp. PS06]MBD8070904.1 DUF3889 domain-containing protein [Bacillus sp. PS06]